MENRSGYATFYLDAKKECSCSSAFTEEADEERFSSLSDPFGLTLLEISVVKIISFGYK
jgi:hypothetical protein